MCVCMSACVCICLCNKNISDIVAMDEKKRLGHKNCVVFLYTGMDLILVHTY